MTIHFNRLTEAEAERLALLIEECSEVQRAATKILRHGYASRNNRIELMVEIGDLQHVLALMFDAQDIFPGLVAEYKRDKAVLIEQYLHHQQRPSNGLKAIDEILAEAQ